MTLNEPVRLEGVKATLAAMRKYEPNLLAATQLEIAQVTQKMVGDAQGFAPSAVPAGLSGWEEQAPRNRWFRMRFNASEIRRGIKVTTQPVRRGFNRSAIGLGVNKGFVSTVTFVNQSAAGAIYETAGRKNPNGQNWNPNSSSNRYSKSRNPRAGKHFIESIENDSGMVVRNLQGRIIIRAFDLHKKEVVPAVVKALTTARDKFQGKVAA